MNVRYSTDGLNWSNSVVESDSFQDRTTVFYNPFKKVWVWSIRNSDDKKTRHRSYLEHPDPKEGVKLLREVPYPVKDNFIKHWFSADANDPHNPEEKYKHIRPQIYNHDSIAYESIINIQTPHETPEKFTLIVLAIIIIIKEVSFRIVHNKGKETNSSALKADAWHHRSDALTSVMAFIGISLSIFMGPGYESGDDWAALIASILIVYNAYLIFRPALGEILDEHVYDDMVVQIREIAQKVDGVEGTEKCFVRKTGMTYLVDLHLLVDGNLPVSRGHEISHLAKDSLMLEMPELANVLIHIEPVNK
ncbi:MAG: cation transporter [Flavobacterium sp.]|nr:MAG: cation transporter [Flavobacterium sp.]